MARSDPPTRPSSATRSTWRWLRKATAAITLCVVGWLLAVNVTLWLHVPDRIISGDRPRSTIRVSYGWAWCVWPTTVHVTNLHIAVDTWIWQLDVSTPSAIVDLSLLDLPSKHLHATRIEAEHVTVVTRIKVADQNDPRVHAFGPMPSEFPPAIRRGPRPPAPASDDGWRIDVDDIHAHVQEAWIDELRFRTRAYVRARLHATTHHRLGVPHADIVVREGHLSIGRHPVLDRLSATIEAEIQSYDPTRVHGRTVLGQVSGRIVGGAHVSGLSWLGMYDSPAIHVVPGAGRIEFDVDLSKGTLSPGSVVRQRADALQVWLGESVVRATTKIRAEVVATDTSPRVRIAARVTDMEVHVSRSFGDDEPWLNVPKVDAGLVLSSARLTEPWTALHYSVRVPQFEARTLEPLTARTDAVDEIAGRARGGIEVRRQAGATMAQFTVVSPELALRRRAYHLRANAMLRARVRVVRETWNLQPIVLRLREVVLVTPTSTSEHAGLDLREARLMRVGSRITFDVRGRLDDAQGLLLHLPPNHHIHDLVASLEEAGSIGFNIGGRVRPGVADVTLRRASRRHLRIQGRYRRVGDRSRAAFLIEPLQLGVRHDSRSHHLDIRLARDAWIEGAMDWVGRLATRAEAP